MGNKDLIAIFEYMEREKGIKRDVIISAIEESLQTAAKKNIQGALNISVHLDRKTGNLEVYCEKIIVETVKDPAQEISLKIAQQIDPDCEIGQYIDCLTTPKDFGRIAAQKARQIITQRLRNAERNVIYEEYRHRMGEIISGTVKRFARGADLVVDLGKVEALLPMRGYPKTERYRIGDRTRALLLEVQDTENGGAEVILSRTAHEFIHKLFLQEVPEISDGIVTIHQIVREPGYRTKITVESSDSKIDPVGACVGMRGNRVKNIVQELNNEKVDIVPYSSNPIELLKSALSPIEIRKIFVNEDKNTVSIIVEDDDLANVLGKRGMNARLLRELVDFELDIQKISDNIKRNIIIRRSLAESEETYLDDPIDKVLEGFNTFVIQNLIAEGYDTPRKVLLTSPEDLSNLSGISLELAEEVLEQIIQKRN